MKKILTLFLSVMVAVMSCVMTVSADETPRTFTLQVICEQVKAYIEEQALPVLYISEDLFPNSASSEFLTIICSTKTDADAVRTELTEYVENTIKYKYPNNVFAVLTEEEVQLTENLKAFIADRQIQARMILQKIGRYTNMICVYFLPDSYDRATDSWRGDTEVKKYLEFIHVDACDFDDLDENYDLHVMLMWTDAGDASLYPMRGDINKDGKIDSLDAQLVLNNSLDLALDNGTEPLAGGDLDGDGAVTSLDAQYILLFYLRNDVLNDIIMWRDILPA